MSGWIAKVDHFIEDLPVLRSPAGVLHIGDPDVLSFASEGDVIALGPDGQWRLAPPESWESVPKVGSAELVNERFVMITTPTGLTRRDIGDGQDVSVGDLVVYDERPAVLEIVKGARPSRNTLLDDDFDVASIRTELPRGEWSAFAGFPSLVREARELTAVHLNGDARKALADLGVSPVRGVLFEGPPGTGKTFLAQIMAAQSGATFYLVTTASLGGRLVSESEQRLQKIYADATDREGLSIVFIDEIDALTGHRDGGDSGASRLVNVFLTSMDGVSPPENVVTIGTTNRVDTIDRALRRPGRFDRTLTFSYPNAEDRLAILNSRNRRVDGALSFAHVVENTAGWTAADLEAIWQHAGELTVIKGRSAIRDDHFLMGLERASRAREERLRAADEENH